MISLKRFPQVEEELKYPGNLKRGDEGPEVKRLQEWLCLSNILCKVDGEFGPVTEACLKKFQNQNQAPSQNGVLTPFDFLCLVISLKCVLSIRVLENDPVSSLLAILQGHLNAQAREVGGQNSGPWVRIYTVGFEGVDYPWCAGFVSFCLRYTAVLHDKPEIDPLGSYTCSCDHLAELGQGLNQFHAEGTYQPKPGDIFLLRRDMNDWVHTGFVIAAAAEHFETVEGNTSTITGTREGYEVAARHRGYANMDFISVPF